MNKFEQALKNVLVASTIVGASLAPAPMYKDRRNGLDMATPIEEVAPDKEVDEKLALLEQIDSFGAAVAGYVNRDWRRDIIEMQRDPSKQYEATSLFAKAIEDQVNQARVMQGLPPVVMTDELNLQALFEEDMRAKRELWEDLTGEKKSLGIKQRDESLNESVTAKVENRYQQALEGEEPLTADELVVSKIFELQKRFGPKGRVPLNSILDRLT